MVSLGLGRPPPPASDDGSLLDGPDDSLDPVEQLADRLVHALWVIDETFSSPSPSPTGTSPPSVPLRLTPSPTSSLCSLLRLLILRL